VDEKEWDVMKTWFYTDPVRSHTSCGQKTGRCDKHVILCCFSNVTYFLWMKNREMQWVHNSALIQQDHVLPVDKKREGTMSVPFCTNPTRWHTTCRQKRGHDENTIPYQSNKITYLLWMKNGEMWWRHIPHGSNEITYSLWTENGGILWVWGSTSNPRDHIHPVGKKRERGWRENSALIQQDHIPSVGKKWEDTMEKLFCTNSTRSHTACGQKTGRCNEHTIVHWSSKITYILWVKNREMQWAHNSALI
jgi:hypothetical protein